MRYTPAMEANGIELTEIQIEFVGQFNDLSFENPNLTFEEVVVKEFGSDFFPATAQGRHSSFFTPSRHFRKPKKMPNFEKTLGGWRTLRDGFELPGGRPSRSQRVGALISFCVCDSLDGINADQSALEIRGEDKAAPRQVARMIDRFSFQQLQMHEVKLFDSLLQTPQIKIAEAVEKKG
jgi:hypothetical protein